MANDIQTGFIFKDQKDEIYLGIFENSSVASFNQISDWEGIYNDLLQTKIIVAEVRHDSNDRIMINDLCSLEVGKDKADGEFIAVEVITMLEELEFPSEDADTMFAGFAREAGRGN